MRFRITRALLEDISGMIETYTYPLDTTGDNHIKQASLRKTSNIYFVSSVLPRLRVPISSRVYDLTG